jgi:hypothetical protein
LVLFGGLLWGCAERDPGTTSETSSLSFAEVHPLFVAKCADASCHGGGSASIPGFAQMDRSSAYEAGLPVFEFMWGRLTSGNMPAGKGCVSDGEFVEPPPPGCLDATERDVVRVWLDRGYVE